MHEDSQTLLILTDEIDTVGKWNNAGNQWQGYDVTVAWQSDFYDDLDDSVRLAIVDAEAEVISREVLDLCNRLRLQMTDPILLLTRDQDESRLFQAYNTGIDSCILKPINNTLLIAKISAWLHHANGNTAPAPQ